jgi:hypothetical protein
MKIFKKTWQFVLVVLVLFTVYLIWVALNVSDLNLNIAACVVFFTMGLLAARRYFVVAAVK